MKFAKNLSKLSEKYHFSKFDEFLTIAGTIFWTNLGFGVFFNAVRGRRVRNPRLHVRLRCTGLARGQRALSEASHGPCEDAVREFKGTAWACLCESMGNFGGFSGDLWGT